MGSAPAETLDDPTIYPTTDNMGEGSLQRFISELFRGLVERWLATTKKKPSFVGANQFIYFHKFHPKRCIAPDVFVLPGVRPGIKIDSWKTWTTGVTPSFALEVVSKDFEKDYRDAPGLYEEMGVRELVIFDPEYEDDLSERLRFQVYRRLPKRGLVRVEVTNEDRVRSRVLGCHLRSVGEDLDNVRLRIATGPTGENLVPTELEAAREALAEAEAENASLRAELLKLRGARQ
jgi:Uma2 family endonuclease